jgi:hypothetical protein
MHRVELSDKLPPCSRCGGKVITSVVMPQDDAAGRPIQLQLCSSCDADKPAAGALLRWFATGGGHDLSRADEGARLLLEWTKEGMGEHGWYWSESTPDDAPPRSEMAPDEAAVRRLLNPGNPGRSPRSTACSRSGMPCAPSWPPPRWKNVSGSGKTSGSWASPSPRPWRQPM